MRSPVPFLPELEGVTQLLAGSLDQEDVWADDGAAVSLLGVDEHVARHIDSGRLAIALFQSIDEIDDLLAMARSFSQGLLVGFRIVHVSLLRRLLGSQRARWPLRRVHQEPADERRRRRPAEGCIGGFAAEGFETVFGVVE